MPDIPKIGVVICTLNRRESLLACLEAISSQDHPADKLGVWVYDDGSIDGTGAAAAAALAGMRARGMAHGEVLSGAGGEGIAYGRNEAARKAAAHSDLLLFIDDDVLPGKECVSGLAAALAGRPAAGIAAPLLLRSDTKLPLHAPYFVSPVTFRYGAGNPFSETFCDWVDPACIMVRTEAFSAAGGFWQGYFRSHEGVDFCLKAAAAGHRTFYCPTVSAVHVMRAENISPERLYYLYRNKFLVVRRNGSFLHKLLLLPLLAAALLPKYLASVVFGRVKLTLKGLSAISAAAADGFTGKEGRRERP